MDFPPYIDSSILTAWRACRRKHFWSTLHSLYPTGKSVHLIAGAAVAAGLEAARRECFSTSNPKEVSHDNLLLSAYLPFLRQWCDYSTSPLTIYTPPETSSKTFVNSFAALEHYLLQHPPATDALQPYIRPDGSPAIEYKFAIPIDDIRHPVSKDPILFVGRFDMVGVLQTPSISLICGVDDKTTGSITYDWANKWDLRGQFLGYIWALRQHGIKVNHFCINGLAILKTKSECRRALVMYPDHMIERWEHLMKLDLRQMLQAWEHYSDDPTHLDHLYPYNFADSCESYGGCAFTTLCQTKHPHSFFNNYVSYRFNPLEIQPITEVNER